MKKIINFLDSHRLILVILILILISVIFIGTNSFIFLNHKFKNINCTKDIDEVYCYHKDIKIYKNPVEEKIKIFKEKGDEIKELKEKYKLPSFNFYTSYYYEVASLLNYNETEENEELLIFFKNYNASYKIEDFYEKNTFYYGIFYPYKINLN